MFYFLAFRVILRKTKKDEKKMEFISVFDVIGPNMIGPSSSHTAGAVRIALLAGKMMHRRIVKADFVL